jgi:hypothetical protein
LSLTLSAQRVADERNGALAEITGSSVIPDIVGQNGGSRSALPTILQIEHCAGQLTKIAGNHIERSATHFQLTSSFS